MTGAGAPAGGLDLTNCDREPIHVPGAIQPHGVMLVADPATMRVLQTAGDTARLTGGRGGDLLGSTLSEALDDALAEAAPLAAPHGREPAYLGVLRTATDGAFDVHAHSRDGHLILELEAATANPWTAAEVLAEVRRAGNALQAAADLAHLCAVGAREARRLTGFDRVMVYRFIEDGSGAVIAEAGGEALGSFMNQRFPASDIPRQARALYLQNLIRVIPDAGYRPAPLNPPLSPLTDAPLDMSDCVLRSVSPVHLEYLKHMGVAASMSVSLVRDGRLWGLLAFHHATPKAVPYELREACKHLGEMLSQQIKARLDLELHRQREKLATLRRDLVGVLSRAPVLREAANTRAREFLNLMPAEGFAMRVGGEVVRHGACPGAAEITALTNWLSEMQDGYYATHHLQSDYPPGAAFTGPASGLAAAILSRGEPWFLLWFRAEEIEIVEWAGNPHKPALPGEEPGQLTPRQSFEAWKETVRGRARPWSSAEVDALVRLRESLLELRRREQLSTLNTALRQTLEEKDELLAQKDLLMQEVHHRVQNSLQLVNSMLQLQSRSAGDGRVRSQFDEASRRLMAVSMVHRRLWRSGDIQEVNLATYLEDLVAGLLESWGDGWTGCIHLAADAVRLPTRDAVILALVVAELMTNAVKYAYGGEPGPIHVELRDVDPNFFSLTVRDHGVGQAAGNGTEGLGSRMTRALATQLGGEIAVSADGSGRTVVLTIARAPSRRP